MYMKKINENIAFDMVFAGQKRKKAYVYWFSSNFLSKFISHTTDQYKLLAPTVVLYIVVSTNKRSQAGVFTVYLSLAARHKYLEDDIYNVALFIWSAESSQYTQMSIYTPLTLAS